MSEIKVECTGCKAHYIIEDADLEGVVCPACQGDKFSVIEDSAADAGDKVDTEQQPQAPAAEATQPPAAQAPSDSEPQHQAPGGAPRKPAAQAPAPRKKTAAAPATPSKAAPTFDRAESQKVGQAAVEDSIKEIQNIRDRIISELKKVIVGQVDVIEELTAAILGGGHCLLEGVPGLAKTLLISSLSQAMSLSFKRIQFTPDLMPSDITGTEVLQEDQETGRREFKFLPGPIFANIVLADEINRTPPKTQASLLEAMQERQVSVGGTIHKLQLPFFVLATQNPLEQEGTYPLPEAQQDRFIFKIFVDYPLHDEEMEVVRRVTEQNFGKINQVCEGEELLRLQKVLRQIPVADAVIDYANRLVRATRLKTDAVSKHAVEWLSVGAGPRATINLVTAARCFCALDGRSAPSCDDVARAAHPVLRHRIGLNYVARAEGLNTDDVIEKLLADVPKY